MDISESTNPDQDGRPDVVPAGPANPTSIEARAQACEEPSTESMITVIDDLCQGGKAPATVDEGLTRVDKGVPTAVREIDPASLSFQLNNVCAAGPGPGDSISAERNTRRFTIDHRLGTGGMGVVYQAYDHQRGETVALKTMRRIDPAMLYRFKQEFRALAEVSHPNLVNLYELIAVGEVWFFTMELVQGIDIIDFVRSASEPPMAGNRIAPREPLGPERLARLRRIVRQLAEGVSALHNTGKVHRDVKPNNVLVTSEGRVVLLDFGLTADLGPSGRHQAIGERVEGTVGYMSPEQSAGEPVSAASDWYSVGVILHEALTGLPPIHEGRSEPSRPSDLAVGVPDDLNALCADLLRFDPANRPTGAEVLARLSADPSVTRPGPSGRCGSTSLIGRKRHWEALNAAYARVKAGQPVMMFVSGRPGSGKSTLLQAFLDTIAEEDEALVFRGHCHERESVPYKALDSVVDALCHYLVSLAGDEVNALLPGNVALLARMFPVLRRVEAIAAAPDAEATDGPEMRRQAVAALRELLAAVGRTRTLVVAIDDLQWGDPENAALIEDLVRPPGAPLMLLLGVYRTVDSEESALIHALLTPASGQSEWRELTVGALTNVESRELALALLGRNDRIALAQAHVVARKSQGNPFFIDELVKHIQSGEGVSDETDVTGRLALDEVLWRRVTWLPAGARKLLEIVAVSGRPVSLHDACQAAGLGAEGRAAAAALRAGKLVRGTVRRHRDEVETYHDWVRETVIAHLAPEVVANHHLRLAEVMEAGGRANDETLALHFQAGGRPDHAAKLYARAAENAAAILAFNHAARLYRRALELRTAPPGDAESVRLLTCLNHALDNAARVRASADTYIAGSLVAAADLLEMTDG